MRGLGASIVPLHEDLDWAVQGESPMERFLATMLQTVQDYNPPPPLT